MADDCVIRVTGLKKSFPKGKEVLHVLKGINMEIRPGEVIGYLGSNGAGKSTTVKIMCGLLEDFEGKVDVLGYDVRENDIEVKKRIGYIPENAVMYEHLTPMEYLEIIVKEVIARLAKEGKTIFYCSHLMDVVEKIASRVILINEGTIIANGSVRELMKEAGTSSLEGLFTKLVGGTGQSEKAEQIVNAFENRES